MSVAFVENYLALLIHPLHLTVGSRFFHSSYFTVTTLHSLISLFSITSTTSSSLAATSSNQHPFDKTSYLPLKEDHNAPSAQKTNTRRPSCRADCPPAIRQRCSSSRGIDQPSASSRDVDRADAGGREGQRGEIVRREQGLAGRDHDHQGQH